jgi:hypothetical protein
MFPPIHLAQLAGGWEFGAPLPSKGYLIFDVVHLTLVGRPAGHLTGSWSEGAIPPLNTGLALNGTECLGCQIPGEYYDRFTVTGTVHGSSFRIEVHDSQHLVFKGGLGPHMPSGALIGCEPGTGMDAGIDGTLYLRFQGQSLVFWPSSFYSVSFGVGGMGPGDYCK